MNMTFIEKLAFNSGHRAAPSRMALSGTLVVVADETPIHRIDFCNGHGQSNPRYVLSYSLAPSGIFGRFRRLWTIMSGFFRLEAVCDRAEIVVLSDGEDRLIGLMAAILGRLSGKRLILYDYRFIPYGYRTKKSILQTICGEIHLGDPDGFESDNHHSHVSIRYDEPDRARYRTFQKRRAIPHVIVYGDLQVPKTVSLIGRVHELVKQKYPRAEFSCISFNRNELGLFDRNGSNHSMRCVLAGSESDVSDIFQSGDILVLLSRGGRNRFFLERALASGFPVITNGIDIPHFHRPGNIIAAARDSYGAIANNIIALVDDELCYQSFSANRLSS